MEKKYVWEIEEEKNKLKEEKIKKRKKEKKQLKRRKIKRISILIIFFLIILFLILFLPYLNTENISYKNNIVYTEEKLTKIINISKKSSLKDLFVYKSKIKKENLYLHKINYEYEKGQIVIEVVENKPIYHDLNQTYIYDNKKKLKKSKINFPTPLMITTKDQNKTKNQIINQLNLLPYDIFLQIKEIKLDSKNNEKVILEMYDGNTVYLYVNELNKKMKYYNQMKNILDEEKKGPGNIYLDIGDYYEEK